MFTLSDDNPELIGWDPQTTGYDKTDYGMLYFAAAGMESQGNVLSFPMQGLVIPVSYTHLDVYKRQVKNSP